MIATGQLSAIGLTYANSAAWLAFDATRLCSGGDLQANWDRIVSAVTGQYRTVLNSATYEINLLEGTGGAEYVGISGITGLSTGSTVYSAILSLNKTVSALNVSAPYAGSAAYAVSASTAANATTAVTAAAATTAINSVSALYAISANYAVSASTAASATHAATASYSVSSDYSLSAATSLKAISATYAASALYAVSASYSLSGAYSVSATTAQYAASAGTLSGLTAVASVNSTVTSVSAMLANKQKAILTAGGAIIPTTAGALLSKVDGTNFTYYTLDFDAASAEYAYWNFSLPENYVASSNINAKVNWISTATTGDVVWGISVLGIVSGGAWDASLGSAQSVTASTNGTAGNLNKTSFAAFNPMWNDNDSVVIKVYRNATATADTLSVDARLLSVEIDYLWG